MTTVEGQDVNVDRETLVEYNNDNKTDTKGRIQHSTQNGTLTFAMLD
jgi:hypothetical protein